MDDVFTQPRNLYEAFDFDTDKIQDWERENIRIVLAARKLVIRPNWHGGKRALQREIAFADIYHCATYGKAKSKDPPPWDPEEKGVRKPGINYDGTTTDGRRKMRVKVGWTPLGYTVVTAHFLP